MTDADKDDDDGKGFFDDSDDDGDNEKAPTKAVSKRERIEALQKKKRAAIPAENKKIKSKQQQPIADAGPTLKDKGYESGDSYDSDGADFQRTKEDNDFIDMDGDDEDAINEVQSSILMTKDLMAPMMKTDHRKRNERWGNTRLSTMDDPITAVASDIPLIDSASMIALLQVNQQTMTGQRRQRRVATHDDDDDASVATTRIASSVGSVVGDPRNAFLKSMTIVVTDNTINQLGLDLVLKDVMPRPTRNRLAIVGRKSKPEIQVEHIGGMFELSHIEPGDVLQSINQMSGRTVPPSNRIESASASIGCHFFHLNALL